VKFVPPYVHALHGRHSQLRDLALHREHVYSTGRCPPESSAELRVCSIIGGEDVGIASLDYERDGRREAVARGLNQLAHVPGPALRGRVGEAPHSIDDQRA